MFDKTRRAKEGFLVLVDPALSSIIPGWQQLAAIIFAQRQLAFTLVPCEIGLQYQRGGWRLRLVS
ncbi:MAG: hypothetical protein H6821_07760 [Planctomycetaceae bacterium]|nr:hypothetical protein [Planctomycetales bacterium]MCB9874061.1 hypothetical protein [Planctomycetaceae bacterium]MCB9937685.1 hypothetical protein [Planctomycetaceae bacterium]HRX80444.1 hypothetical protein [Pirellulaceae bacterium]